MLKAPGSIHRFLFHFLRIFPQIIETMLIAYVSFFNEVATET
jgi:hypothetical protein